jgi:polar amino acid transport system permease protein
MLSGYLSQLAGGAAVTLAVAACSAVIGLVLGLAGGAASLSRSAWVRAAVRVPASVVRGVPELLILLVCYFGASAWIYRLTGRAAAVSPFAAGVFALSVVFAAYASEAFRGAFAAVPRGQTDAARALGLRPFQIFRLVQLPQAWRLALPSLGNQWQSLLKDTSLVSVLGLEDLMRRADMAGQATGQPFLFLGVASLIYFAFLLVSGPVLQGLERRAARGGIGR